MSIKVKLRDAPVAIENLTEVTTQWNLFQIFNQFLCFIFKSKSKESRINLQLLILKSNRKINNQELLKIQRGVWKSISFSQIENPVFLKNKSKTNFYHSLFNTRTNDQKTKKKKIFSFPFCAKNEWTEGCLRVAVKNVKIVSIKLILIFFFSETRPVYHKHPLCTLKDGLLFGTLNELSKQ